MDDWLKYFPNYDMQHNFADGKKPSLFPKVSENK